MQATTETPAPVIVAPDVAAAVRLLNVHRAKPGEEALRRAAGALKEGHRVEAESAPAPLRRLMKRLGARALVFHPDVHVYELAALWELGETRPDRLDERLKQYGVRRISFDTGESQLAAACLALELALEETDPSLKETLMKFALRAAATYRGRAAAIPAKPRT